MKLSSSAFFVLTVGVGCGKTTNANAAAAAAAADDPNTAADSNKNKDKNPIANVTVADVPAAAITARNLIAPTCSGNKKLIEVDVFTDQDPEETLWTVTKNIEYEGEVYTSTTPILSGGPYSQQNFLFQDAWCVPKGQYKFNIYVRVSIVIVLVCLPHPQRHASLCLVYIYTLATDLIFLALAPLHSAVHEFILGHLWRWYPWWIHHGVLPCWVRWR